MFEGCENLECVELPESIERIGWGAFRGCRNLKEIHFPEKLEEISPDAFSGCPNAFSGCTDAQGFLIRNSILLAHFGKEPIHFIPNGIKKIRHGALASTTFADTDLQIPASVAEIDERAFARTNVTSVVLPDGLTELRASVFEDCSQLRRVVLPESITKICSMAFFGSEKALQEVHIATLESWCRIEFEGISNPLCDGANLFVDGAEQKDVVIPASVSKLNPYAFEGSGIESVILSEGAVEIGECAFWGCKKLRHVSIPSTVKKIAPGAFSRCPKLRQMRSHPRINPIGLKQVCLFTRKKI